MLKTDIAQVKAELDAAPYGCKKKTGQKIAERYGVSYATLMREVEKEYGVSKRIKREKKISDDLIHEVAKVKETLKMTGKKEREIATDIVIQHLVDKGIAGAEELTVATVNRRLREKGYRQEASYVRVEAGYANQQHQLDFSRSEYFQVHGYDRNIGDYILKITRNVTHYKENEFKLRTWIAGLTDAYSRLSLAKAYVASGESVHLGIDFLNFAYNREPDEYPMRYLPERMKMDNGSFGKSKDVKEFLAKLDIKPEFATPNEKRGIQKRESAWKMMWRRFELKLVLKLGDGGTISLSEYNALLHDFMIELMEAKHPVRNQTRGHVYLTSISQKEQRLMTEDLKKYLFKVVTRIVSGDKTISLEGEKYQVPENILVGEEIRVYKNLENEVIGELINNPKGQKPFILNPTKGYIEIDDFEHRSHNTYRQDIQTEVKNEKKNKVKYMPVREKKVKPETVFTQKEQEVFSSRYEAQKYIAKQLINGETYDDYAWLFDEMLQADLTKTGIDSVLQALKQQKMMG
jgi:transposase InsO family protein